MAPVGDYIENRVFDDIAAGQSASLTRTLTERDMFNKGIALALETLAQGAR